MKEKKEKQFKPMLADTIEDVNTLKYPVLASPKLDGVRAVVKDGVVLSRSLKPIPNKHVQKLFSHLEGLDGELIVGESTAEDVYRKTVSGVMSEDGEPNVVFYVFDCINNPEDSFLDRLTEAFQLTNKASNVQDLIHQQVNSAEELLEVEAEFTSRGYEGVMVRSLNGIYKYNRSTLREGYLLKLKRFLDAEAVIIGFEELMHNNNEAKVNELGRTDRSSHKENLEPGDTLGALIVKDVITGVEFKIGTGFTADQRKAIWNIKDELLNELVTYKYFPVGVKDAPRHPVFKGFRDKRDL